jgi:hydrogenase maturation protease
MRVIGCGNAFRGDDGAGIMLVRRLRELGVAALEIEGDASALVEAWNGADDVILVDAVVTGAPPGTVHLWEGGRARLPPGPCTSSHGLGIAEAVGLAHVLGRLPRRFRLYGFEGRRFAPGSAASPEVLLAVEAVARRIAAEVADALAGGAGTHG